MRPPRIPTGPTFAIERARIAAGRSRIAGVDEAGRGPLAGPVVAAAVVMDPDRLPAGLDDSKKLDAPQRERLFEAILAQAHVGLATASPARIDRLNIRGATLDTMARAVTALAVEPDLVLVDGRDLPRLPCPGEAIIGGDALVASIAAASIVAKVVRDRIMRAADRVYPAYGFASHVGYPTPAHRAALRAHGPCPLHRLSFRPVREALALSGINQER